MELGHYAEKASVTSVGQESGEIFLGLLDRKGYELHLQGYIG